MIKIGYSGSQYAGNKLAFGCDLCKVGKKAQKAFSPELIKQLENKTTQAVDKAVKKGMKLGGVKLNTHKKLLCF